MEKRRIASVRAHKAFTMLSEVVSFANTNPAVTKTPVVASSSRAIRVTYPEWNEAKGRDVYPEKGGEIFEPEYQCECVACFDLNGNAIPCYCADVFDRLHLYNGKPHYHLGLHWDLCYIGEHGKGNWVLANLYKCPEYSQVHRLIVCTPQVCGS